MINTEIISSINDVKINAELDVVTAILESYSKTLDILSETNGDESIIQESVLFMEASSEKTGDKSSGNKKFLNSLIEKIKGVINTIIEGFKGVINGIFSAIKFKNTGDMYQLYNDLEFMEIVSKIRNKRASTNTPTQEYFYALDDNDNIIFQEYDELIDDDDDDIFQEGWLKDKKEDDKINDKFMAELENADPLDIYKKLQKALKQSLDDHYSTSLRSGVIKKNDIISMINTLDLIAKETGSEDSVNKLYEAVQQLSKSGDMVENARASAKHISAVRMINEIATELDRVKEERGSLAFRTALEKEKEKDESYFNNMSESEKKYFHSVKHSIINNIIKSINKKYEIFKDFLNADPQKVKPMDENDVRYLIYGGSPAGIINEISLLKQVVWEYISKPNGEQKLFSRIQTSLMVLMGLIRNDINTVDNNSLNYSTFSNVISKETSVLSKTFESLFSFFRLVRAPFNIFAAKLKKNINEIKNSGVLNSDQIDKTIKNRINKATAAIIIEKMVGGILGFTVSEIAAIFLLKLFTGGVVSATTIVSIMTGSLKITTFAQLFKLIKKCIIKPIMQGRKLQNRTNSSINDMDENNMDINGSKYRVDSKRGIIIANEITKKNNKKANNAKKGDNTVINNTTNNNVANNATNAINSVNNTTANAATNTTAKG